MLSSHHSQVFLEPLLDGNRQHRPPVFLAFTPSNGNFMPVKVEVLHSGMMRPVSEFPPCS